MAKAAAEAEAAAKATLSTRRCCCRCIVSSLIVYLHIFSNVLCSPTHTYLYLYLYLYLYFYSYSYAHSYLALTLILGQCVLRSQRLCSTPALLFCHLTFVDNLHTFYLFQYCCFSLLSAASSSCCCCCLEARICFVAKWHRALGKCVKIQSVAGALEAWKGTARHRGQVYV